MKKTRIYIAIISLFLKLNWNYLGRYEENLKVDKSILLYDICLLYSYYLILKYLQFTDFEFISMLYFLVPDARCQLDIIQDVEKGSSSSAFFMLFFFFFVHWWSYLIFICTNK